MDFIVCEGAVLTVCMFIPVVRLSQSPNLALGAVLEAETTISHNSRLHETVGKMFGEI